MRSVSRSPSMSSWMFAGRPLPRHRASGQRGGGVSCGGGHLKVTKHGGPSPHLSPPRAGVPGTTYLVQGEQPAAVSEEALQHSQWPFR